VEINQCFTICGLPGSVERRGTGINTPSSRRRVDGVKDDATVSFLGDDAAVLAPSSGEESAPPRHRASVASMDRAVKF